MPVLFENTTVKSLELKNRAIRSATWSGIGDQKGRVAGPGVEIYSKLADGGIGLIITGFQYVMPNGVGIPYQLGNYSDDLLDGLKRLTGAVHSRGSIVMAQLCNTRSKANPELFSAPAEIWGPSAVPDPVTGNTPKEMTQPDITQLVQAYAAAASRSKRAGLTAYSSTGPTDMGSTSSSPARLIAGQTSTVVI